MTDRKDVTTLRSTLDTPLHCGTGLSIFHQIQAMKIFTQPLKRRVKQSKLLLRHLKHSLQCMNH